MIKRICLFAFLITIFCSYPFSKLYAYVSNQSADVVLGHECLTQAGDNDSSNSKSKSLSSPRKIYVNGGKLFVVDTGNHRVLIYNNADSLASSNAAADVVIGQPDFCSRSANQGLSQPAANTLDSPFGAAVYGEKLLIADASNNRVLVFNQMPTSNNASADVVIGQPNMNSGAGLTVSSNTLAAPRGVFVDSNGKLYIADTGNNRVLIYNSIPTSNNAVADAVIGQANFISNSSNRGTGVSTNTLSGPIDVAAAANKLFVVDSSNHRVLLYDPVPTSNNALASIVVGQADMISNSSDQGVSAGTKTLSSPWGLTTDGTNLLIADRANHRVLVYSSIPSSNNASANFVIGQSSMTGESANQNGSAQAFTLNSPSGVNVSGGKVYIADSSNNRLLIFNSVPSSNNASADKVVGQSNMVFTASNQAGPSAASLNYARGIFTDGTKLYVGDSGNHRVLIWNSISSLTSGKNADVFIGQANSTNNFANQTGVELVRSSNTFNFPMGVYVVSGKLFVTDYSNDRVLIFNSVPTVNNSSASYVIGQPDFLTATAENNGDANDDLIKLDGPRAVFSDGQKLWVSDSDNHRIVVYNPIPGPGVSVTTTTIGTINSSGSTAVKLNNPTGLFGLNGKLFVADSSNNRVLIYTSTSSTHIPDGTASLVISTVIVGQVDFGKSSGNAGADANRAAWTLNAPNGAWSDGTKLWIADLGNNRVLQFNSIPTTHASSASVVLGQFDFNSAQSNVSTLFGNETSANGLEQPLTIFGISGKLFVLDSNNYRALVFNDLDTNTTPSSSPSSFVGTALGVSSITWTWTALGNAWHQVVASTGGAVSPILVANTTFYTEVGLSTNTAYSRAIAVSFNSNFSNASTATAVNRYTSAANVLNLTTETVTSNSVKFNWNTNTNPDGTRYVVQLSSRAAFLPVEISTPVAYADALTASTTTISGLMPGTTVALRVMAYNGDAVAASTFSNVVQATLLMPSGFSTNVSSATISTTTFAGGSSSFLGADQATTLIISQGTTLPNSAAGGTLAISTNPLITPLTVSTTAITAALNDASSSGQTALADSVREFVFFDPFGKGQAAAFGQNVTLRIPYPDANQDGFVDTDTRIPEKKLKIFKLNEALQRWEETGGTVNESSNFVSVNVASLSVYALLAGAATSNLDNVLVYPTPWQKGAGGQFDAPNLIFDNLTAQAKIQVFTALGELVWEKETSSSGGSVFWDGKNMKGENAASGVYLWRATNNSGQSKQGRLAIER